MKLQDALACVQSNGPMDERAIVEFFQNRIDSVEFDNGVKLDRSGQNPQARGCYVQYQNSAFLLSQSVHYEVIKANAIRNEHRERGLYIRLDDERNREDDMRGRLRDVADQNQIYNRTAGGNTFQLFANETPIDCGQDPESVLTKIWEGLKFLYDNFDSTLRQFGYSTGGAETNHQSNENPNAETTNRSDSTNADMNTEIQTLLKSNLNVILTGAPGTGKTYTAKQVACAMTGDDPKAEVQPHIESVQFHPGYDYSDFVIGMKPVLLDEDGKVVKPEESGKGKLQVSFRWKKGIFMDFAQKAKDAYDNAEDKGNAPKFVFLIDEINRADLSRVFGELFSLLEEEYRYPNNKKGITLPNGDPFVIPRNLYIIGTMNDIDRSVESMDFALRRRFAWKEVRAKDTQKDIFDAKKPDGSAKIDPVDAEKLKKAMDALNFEIAGEEVDGKKPTLDLRLGPEYELGGAIFAKFEKCGDFKDLWRNHIEIILNEYLRGRKEKNALLTSLKGLFFKSVGMTAP